MEQWHKLHPLWQQTLNWQPTLEQQQLFLDLYAKILEGNQQFNLTRIIAPLDFWEKHLWDAIAPLFYTSELSQKSSLKVIDIGTGAGFPGVPVAITFPQWQVDLLDSIRKKIMFLNSLSTQLHLKNIHPLVARVESLGQDKYYRQTYDLALIRAVAEASVCAEYALPLLKMGGQAILYRGQWTEIETQTLTLTLEKLGGQLSHIEAFTTPLSQSIRHGIYLRKIRKTPPEFPRSVGIPTQHPLI